MLLVLSSLRLVHFCLISSSSHCLSALQKCLVIFVYFPSEVVLHPYLLT